jgi:hypothetical protein
MTGFHPVAFSKPDRHISALVFDFTLNQNATGGNLLKQFAGFTISPGHFP